MRLALRSILLFLFAGLFVAAAIWPAARASAQENEAVERQQVAEFVELFKRWEQTQDTDEKIALGEQMLALEPAIKGGLLKATREQVKGELWFNLGYAYTYRIRGDRADNLEKAIAAYEAALTVLTRDALPSEWALTQSNLGLAYRNRIRGDRADNLEKAISAYEAALTVLTRDRATERMGLDAEQPWSCLSEPYPRRSGGQSGEGDCRL